MRRATLMVIGACLLIAADEPPEVRKDAQSAVEPKSGPGVGQKYLEKFVGEWHVSKAFFPRGGEPVRVQGHCRQTMIHEGRFLQSEFVFEQGGKKTTGLGLIGFDPESEAFTSVWTDSRQTGMSLRQSRDPFDGQSIVLFSRSLDAPGKEARRSRTVSRLEEGGHKIVHRQYSLGPGENERLIMELIMTRRAENSPRPK